MQRVRGEQHAAQAQLRDQGLHRRDLVGRARDLLVRQDERRLGGKGTEHVRGGAVVQVVEAAPQRLAVERDNVQSMLRNALAQLPSMAAEGGLERVRIKSLKEVAQRVDRRRAAQPSAEDRVEPLAMHADEHQNAAIQCRPGEYGQHREEQQMREGVASALAAARVGDRFERGEQGGKGHHGGLQHGGYRANKPVTPMTSPPQTGEN
jgi:hypothetical protein